MGKPSAPTPPDYAALAKQQGIDNKEAAVYNSELNRVNQVTSDGTSTWSQTPSTTGGSPTWTQTVALSQEQQKLKDGQTQISQNLLNVATTGLDRVGNSMKSPMDTSNLPAVRYAPDPSKTQTSTLDMGTMLSPLIAQAQRAEASRATAGQGAAGQATATGNISSTIDRSGLRALPGSIDDTSRRRVEEALMSRINPSMRIDEDRLRNRLLNSGIEVGTDAYNRELTLSGQRTTDARMQAILAGGQEESRQVGLTQGLQAQEFQQAQAQASAKQAAESQMYAQQNAIAMQNAGMATQTSNNNAGMQTQTSLANANNETSVSQQSAALEAQRRQSLIDTVLRTQSGNSQANQQNFAQGLAASTADNTTRARSLEEFFAMRQQPLNELNALRTGAQVATPTFGNYYTGGNAAAAPTMDAGIAKGVNDQATYKTQVASNNALWSGLASAGTAMISVVRLKKNITRTGDHPSGVGRYTWDWKDGSGSSHGVLAQELLSVHPAAVVTMPDGYLAVRYGMIGGQ